MNLQIKKLNNTELEFVSGGISKEEMAFSLEMFAISMVGWFAVVSVIGGVPMGLYKLASYISKKCSSK